MSKPKTPPKPKRAGTAIWLADQDGPLLRAIAAAEDRPMQTIMRRALQLYAAQSVEYRAARGE